MLMAHEKVKSSHLKRDAYLYIRQSTLRQVFENTESTKRQYALRERAMVLGWTVEQVKVIDSDLGQSGASSDREGFKKLVGDVGIGRVGIVLGLEVSRLARNSVDWCRLLEICAITDTLILDEDGIYHPGDFNDRLLLGLKGTMSEAELHILKARMRGGQLSKARRGELKIKLPIGFAYDYEDKVILDPDIQIQSAVRAFFETFERAGSAHKAVREFLEKGIMFPRRIHSGPRKADVIWAPLTQSIALFVIHNPRYAGAYFYGRTRTSKTIDGKRISRLLPRDEWTVFIPDAHPGYITWEQFEANEACLRENNCSFRGDNRRTPPREGPALLQGIAICGVCGKRMTVLYHQRRGKLIPDYVCQNNVTEHGARTPCQRIPGASVERSIRELLLEAVTPMALDVAISVQKEMADRVEESDNLRKQQVERVQYETDLAKRRYMRVDPDNRLVANQLEAAWNHKLRELSEAQEEYERKSKEDNFLLDEKQREKIMSLSTDFHRLWMDSSTPNRERKRMVRLLLEDVTMTKKDRILLQIRFKGGAIRTLKLPAPLPIGKLWVTDPAIIKEIDHLLGHHTDAGVSRILRERGLTSCDNKPFTTLKVSNLKRQYKLKDRFTRLRESGMMTAEELGIILSAEPDTIKCWRRKGFLVGHPFNSRGECLFEMPDKDMVEKLSAKLYLAGKGKR
ncbi:MAG: recombinase family protein [Candidatus Aegiribacteria sp.]|nr:recombinase family protein [Candidatus Aegiribacteria sp.]